jgi:ferredoxin/flavodoxin---NADP+ reductase
MYPILEARPLAPDVKLLRVRAPRIARKRRAGQFVIVRVHERGERIPLTIADADPDRGDVALVVQGVGKTTRLLNSLETGDSILDVVGPLGRPSEVRRFGTACVVGGGVGAAIAYPTAVALKQAGNRLVAILGARRHDLVILEDEIRGTSDVLVVTTDDGSRGGRGLVTDALTRLLAAGERLDYVLAVGPVAMMRAVAETTRPLGIPTVASLNSIMIDGTGMCGGCRVVVGGRSRFACVDGPEFDAHQVDFEGLSKRLTAYMPQEKEAMQLYQHKCACEAQAK